MASVWLQSALWLGLALLASLISIRVAVSVALIEIVVGAVHEPVLVVDPDRLEGLIGRPAASRLYCWIAAMT